MGLVSLNIKFFVNLEFQGFDKFILIFLQENNMSV